MCKFRSTYKYDRRPHEYSVGKKVLLKSTLENLPSALPWDYSLKSSDKSVQENEFAFYCFMPCVIGLYLKKWSYGLRVRSCWSQMQVTHVTQSLSLSKKKKKKQEQVAAFSKIMISFRNFGCPCARDNQKSRRTTTNTDGIIRQTTINFDFPAVKLNNSMINCLFHVRTTKNLDGQPEIVIRGITIYLFLIRTLIVIV